MIESVAEQELRAWRQIADDLYQALRGWPYPVPQHVTNALVAYDRRRDGRH